MAVIPVYRGGVGVVSGSSFCQSLDLQIRSPVFVPVTRATITPHAVAHVAPAPRRAVARGNQRPASGRKLHFALVAANLNVDPIPEVSAKTQ